MELELGLRGLTTYAETISLYGTEQVFVDGDDTPWSKAFLCSAYASRGLKMRVTSGGGAEVLMGAAEGKSMCYLESRCVALARAMGAQGVQNGGIDGASVVGSVPEGMRELLAENLLVMLRDLESCSGNDSLISESDMRRTAHTVPLVLAGSDFLFSGFGSVVRYDNMFGPSNFNGEDLDDYLVMQRDWGVDGGLRPVDQERLRAVRERAARAVQAVYRELGLADYGDDHVAEVVIAQGSKDLSPLDPTVVLEAADAIQERQVGILDVVRALERTGFHDEAERVLAMGRARVAGDYLQTAAIFDEEMNVLSKVTDPNDYQGPGTGYEVTTARRTEMTGIRQQRSRQELLEKQAVYAGHVRLIEKGEAEPGVDPREVCVGVSPAFATTLWLTSSGLPVGEALRQIMAGLEEEGCLARLVRVRSTIDVGMIGLTAAKLAGSGIGIGLQAKGTALIHRGRDLPPLASLELYSIAPLLTKEIRTARWARTPAVTRKASDRSPCATPIQSKRSRLATTPRSSRWSRSSATSACRISGPSTSRWPDERPRPVRASADGHHHSVGRSGKSLPGADIEIHPDTLRRQASVAEQHGNPQLADNLRRAAELTAFGDDEVLAIYEALGPGARRWPNWRPSRLDSRRRTHPGVRRSCEKRRRSTSGADCKRPPESGPAGSQPS